MNDSPISNDVIQAYDYLMREIKLRIECIDSVLKGKIGPLRVQMAEELCYLQLRMICEIIAVGCLLMHGNLKPKADLLKTHKADWIMTELSKLHPDFFPESLEPDVSGLPNGSPEWIPKTSGYLTKDELRELWNRHCGYKLHRGSAKDIMNRKAPDNFQEPILNWRLKIVKLLERHTISTPGREWLLYVSMNSARAGGDVWCELFRKRSEQPPK